MNDFIRRRIRQVRAPRGRIARNITVLAFAGLFAAACSDSTSPDVLSTLTIAPTTPTVAVNQTVQFTAAGTRVGIAVTTLVGEVWSVSGGGSIDPNTGLFTAGSAPGTSTITVTCGGLTAQTTVIVTGGALATITVTPNPASMQTGATQQFTAVGRDAGGNVVAITPVWSVTSGGGTIDASTGLFTAGTTTGTFDNTVRATQGAIFGVATAIVTAPPPPPPPPSSFRVLAQAAVTCTDGSIAGDVGTFQAAAESPPGSITLSSCPITGGTTQVGTPTAKLAYNDFVTAYTNFGATACGTVLTGTLAGVTLAPGVYCFDAAAALTGTVTLNGPADGVWLFKIGTGGTGALTGSSFTVQMAGGAQACNVTWWARDGATMTDSFAKGNILAGAGISLTRGTFDGNAWSQADVTVTGTNVTDCAP